MRSDLEMEIENEITLLGKCENKKNLNVLVQTSYIRLF